MGRSALQEGDGGAARGHEEIRRPEQAAGTVGGVRYDTVGDDRVRCMDN